MTTPRFNWPIWAGFLLSFVAPVSYPLVFVWWPVTRDFPWAPLLLFAVAAVFLFLGVRRAFAPGRRLRSKIISSIVAALSGVMFAIFVFSVFVAARWLPPAHGAPQLGQKAPAFSLVDTSAKTVSLADLLSEPINGKAPKGILLVFYRGYW